MNFTYGGITFSKGLFKLHMKSKDTNLKFI